eukprot:TRINITY_DN9370_c0_g1_i1.p1 TRINITY_DN9370_c0_g1~~TRINITY_DN9370_c0_g1_i1.p1  ORF type:complete len:302 (+),score=98.77 TRINITY_DN9370_c0_g1_i1:72-977(+)
MQLKGRVAVVTGGAAGIGKEIARCFAEHGCGIALCDVNADALAKTKQELSALGVTVSVHRVDVTSREQIKAFAAEVLSAHGKVNILVNNAGIVCAGDFLETEEAMYDSVMKVNLHGVIDCTRAFLPHIVQTDGGCVVNISSVMGIMPLSGISSYNTSKYAVRGFSEQLLQEMRQTHPHVNVLCVHPEWIRTELVNSIRYDKDTTDVSALDATKEQMNQMGEQYGPSARQAAVWIVGAVQRKRSRLLVGWGAVCIDLLVRLCPVVIPPSLVQLTIAVSIPLRNRLLALLGLLLAFRVYRMLK